MCTVTFFPKSGGGYLLAMNRDEQRTRPEATQVRHDQSGGVQYSYPVDPVAGGTWIGCNSRGLTLTLLNRNLDHSEYAQLDHKSRGLIIPTLLKLSSLAEIVYALQEITFSQYAPFTLGVFEPIAQKILVLDSDGKTHHLRSYAWAPQLLTSSSVNPLGVEEYRRDLFNRFLAKNIHFEREQVIRFQLTRIAGHESESVFMNRADARTVSLCLVEFSQGEARLAYTPTNEWPAEAHPGL